jgi:hypothetical protein
MNWNPNLSWPEVTQAEFDHLMQRYEYRRDAWSDCVRYVGRSGQELGFILDDGRGAPTSEGRFFLHPELPRS